MRFDVVKGGAEEARIPKPLAEEEELPEVNMERSWPLTFQGLAGGGSVWQIAGGGFSEMRIDASRAWARPSCGRGSTSPSARTRCTCTATTSGSSRSTASRRIPATRGGRTRSRCIRNQTVVVRPYFDYFPGVYVFHCHAAEHGDMSMMGQMEVVA